MTFFLGWLLASVSFTAGWATRAAIVEHGYGTTVKLPDGSVWHRHGYHERLNPSGEWVRR